MSADVSLKVEPSGRSDLRNF